MTDVKALCSPVFSSWCGKLEWVETGELDVCHDTSYHHGEMAEGTVGGCQLQLSSQWVLPGQKGSSYYPNTLC